MAAVFNLLGGLNPPLVEDDPHTGALNILSVGGSKMGGRLRPPSPVLMFNMYEIWSFE